MKYVVCVYEPDVDPGGFQGDFEVSATDERTAAEIALQEAKAAWGPRGAGELKVWQVREVAGVVRP